jgi:hypothetical protein
VLQFFVVVAVTLLIILVLPDNIQLLECVYNEYKADTHHYLMFLLIYHFLASNSKRAFFDIITQSEYYYYYSKNRIVLIK